MKPKHSTLGYLGKVQASGTQENLRKSLSGRPYFMQLKSGSINGQADDS